MAMEWLWDINIWSALLTLMVLEIVLGIDNITFLTILVGVVLVADSPKTRCR